MDKIREFIKKHQNELMIGGGLIFAYNLGFRRGCKCTDRAVTHFVNKLYKLIEDMERF